MSLTLTGASLYPSGSSSKKAVSPSLSPASSCKSKGCNESGCESNNEKIIHLQHGQQQPLVLEASGVSAAQKKVKAAATAAAGKGASNDRAVAKTPNKFSAASHGKNEKPCCHAHAKAPPRPTFTNNIESLLQNKAAMRMAMEASIKVGTYESFQKLADASREKDKDGAALDLGARGDDGHTLAHWSGKRADDIRFLEYLSKVPGVDLHMPSTDSAGMRPMHWAATEGSIPIVALLLRHLESNSANSTPQANKDTILDDGDHKAGPNDPINARDNTGCTPLLIAAQYGHADLAAFLIKRGADADAVDDSRDTALHWAAYKGSVPVCGLLLHLNGVDGHLDSPDAFGQTPLHLASLRGNIEVVQYLLDEAEAWAEQRSGLASANNSRHSGIGLSSLSQAARYPNKLLTTQDRDGKTPLDLARKKKKVGCEVMLMEYVDRHRLTDNRSRLLGIIRKSCRELISIKSWKTWMGMTQDAAMGAQSPKFPFYLVLVTMTTALMSYPTLFLPVLGGSKENPGLLWDLYGLHAYTLSCLSLAWVFLLLCWKTNPGSLGHKTSEGTTYRRSGASGLCGNDMIKSEIDNQTRELRRLYDETIESFSVETTTEKRQKKEYLPLCHSCRIAKPLRSKHCRVARRCVLLFDHHCPFVGTTIGLYNYRYFYFFLLSLVLAYTGFIPTWLLYVYRCPNFPIGVFLIGAYLCVFIFPAFGLFCYHTQLIAKNLTTNEHINSWRFEYLKGERGEYRNPFDKGFIQNLMSRMIPGDDSFILPSRSGGGGSSLHHASRQDDNNKSGGGDIGSVEMVPGGGGTSMSGTQSSSNGAGGVGRRKRQPKDDEEKRDLLHNVV